MGRFPQPKGMKGSPRWIQSLVNVHTDVLNQAIGVGHIRWLSPGDDDAYAEYRDQAFLDRLGIKLTTQRLNEFWPPGGPQWDALGVADSGQVVLVEAKAHIAELLSPPTQAANPSKDIICRSLAQAVSGLRASIETDRSQRFYWSQHCYQYANRLAHAWFLEEVNQIPVRLVFVNFVGDMEMDGPQTRREWKAALLVLHEALGLRGRLPHYVAEVVIDIRPTVPTIT